MYVSLTVRSEVGSVTEDALLVESMRTAALAIEKGCPSALVRVNWEAASEVEVAACMPYIDRYRDDGQEAR